MKKLVVTLTCIAGMAGVLAAGFSWALAINYFEVKLGGLPIFPPKDTVGFYVLLVYGLLAVSLNIILSFPDEDEKIQPREITLRSVPGTFAILFLVCMFGFLTYPWQKLKEYWNDLREIVGWL